MNTELWTRFLERLKNQVADRCLTYLDCLSCRDMTERSWVLCLPDRASLHYVESNLKEKLDQVLGDVLRSEGKDPHVELYLTLESDGLSMPRKPESGCLPFETMRVMDVSAGESDRHAAFQVSRGNMASDVSDVVPFGVDIEIRAASHLNPNYTFDSFIKGGSNEMAYGAAKAVAANPAGAYNPLFIYGGVGLGKTHLMHAIGNEILQTNQHLRVRYMTSEEFTNDYIYCVTHGQINEFRERIRNNCDVLLLDDIQFVAGKKETQAEFFNVFNELYSSNKQIILTSDKPPQEIKELEERMRSRFIGGLMADIQLPEFETRLEILRRKSRSEGFYIPEDVAQYIASKVTSNVRELEGCIKRIKACADIHKEHISMALAQKLIEPYYQTRTVLLDAKAIIECVCGYFGISYDDMMGKSRAKPYVYPRQIAMYLARTHSSLSFPDLGRAFGRDHTTVLHAVQKITDDLQKKDIGLQADIKRLEEKLFK